MKQAILAGCLALLFAACKKENAADPLTALSAKNRTALVNTEWYGLYRNIGEESIGNNSGFRGYAIAFGSDSNFTFYGAGFTHPGVWTVKGDTVEFKFTDGVQNRWEFNLKNDSLFSGVTLPVPNNFIMDKNLKKIGLPPGDVIQHWWFEATSSALTTMRLTDTFIETRTYTGIGLFYDFPPLKNKIFSATNDGLDMAKLVVVDGKIAWMYNRSGFNYKYNY